MRFRRIPWFRRLGRSTVLLLLAASVAHAQDEPVVRRSDTELRRFVARLEPLLEQVPAAERQGTVLLFQSVLYECGRFEFVRTESRNLHVFSVEEGTPAPSVVIEGGDLRSAEAWRIDHEGALTRFDESAFTVIESPDGQRRLRFDFPAVAAGDRYGWSVSSRTSHGLAFARETLAHEQYLVRGRTRVRGEKLLTHRVVAHNLTEDQVTVTIEERSRGFPTRLLVDVRDVPARTDPAFSAPELLRVPRLDVVRQGRFYQEFDAWTLANDWDVWVALELGQPQAWIEAHPSLVAIASDLSVGAATDREVADLLYRFVRDEIRTVDPAVDERLFGDTSAAINLDLVRLQRDLDEEQDSPLSQRYRDAQQLPSVASRMATPDVLGPARAPHDVLADRAGTRLEKAALFASLLHAMHLPSRFGFGRDRSFGPLDHDSVGAWQFTDAFVVLLTPDLRPDLWYCPTRDDLPGGVLPVGLQAIPMFNVRDDFERELDALWDTAGRVAGPRVQRRVPEWLKRVRVTDWGRWVTTPGNPSDLCARIEESLSFADTGASIELETRGEVALSPVSYLRERFGPSSVREAPVVEGPTPQDIAACTIRATLDLPALPAPPATDAESTPWILPGPALFGRGPLAAWDRTQRDFHVERTTEYLWSVTVPLPPGWNAIEAMPEFVQQHARLQYRAAAQADGGRLVITRRLRLASGTTANAELAETIGTILAFERGNWVVRRAGGDL